MLRETAGYPKGEDYKRDTISDHRSPENGRSGFDHWRSQTVKCAALFYSLHLIALLRMGTKRRLAICLVAA
jgi:hypothetical protein